MVYLTRIKAPNMPQEQRMPKVARAGRILAFRVGVRTGS